MAYKIDMVQGVLQARDIYPEADGCTTSELTNSRIANNAQSTLNNAFANQVSGAAKVKSISPLWFLILSCGVIFGIGYLQK